MSKRISFCRLFLILLLSGLLLAVVCCLCSTRRAKEEPLPPNVEVIVPAERNPCVIYLSPDGRKMMVTLEQKRMLLDLTTGQELPFRSFHQVAWLDSDLAYVTVNAHLDSVVVDTRDMVETPLERIPTEVETFQAVLRRAGQVYVMDDFPKSGTTVIALAQDFKSPSATSYVAFLSGEEAEKILEGIPYIEVLPLWASCPGKVFSHNGEMYGDCASYSDKYYVTGTLSIYTKDGELLTEVSRKGYDASPFGWAHDDSGVYFRFEWAAMWPPVRPPAPILKLLVPTPTPGP